MSTSVESVTVSISNESYFYNKVLVIRELWSISMYKMYYLIWMYGACINKKKDTLYIFPCESNSYFKSCKCKALKKGEVDTGPYVTKHLYPKCCAKASGTYSSLNYETLKYCIDDILSFHTGTAAMLRAAYSVINGPEIPQFDSIEDKNLFRGKIAHRMCRLVKNNGGFLGEIDAAFKYFTKINATNKSFGNYTIKYLQQPVYIWTNIVETKPFSIINNINNIKSIDECKTLIEKQERKISKLSSKIIKLKLKCIAKDEKITSLKYSTCDL